MFFFSNSNTVCNLFENNDSTKNLRNRKILKQTFSKIKSFPTI